MKYLGSLVSGISRESLLEEVRLATDSLNKETIPAMVAASDYARATKFTNKENLELVRVFDRRIERSSEFQKQGNMFGDIAERLRAISIIMNDMTATLEAVLPENTFNEAMQADLANCLRYVEDVIFLNRFSMNMLNVFYEREMGEAVKNNEIEMIPKRVIRMVADYFEMYVGALNAMAVKKEVFKKVMAELAPLSVNQRGWEAVERNTPRSKIAPFTSGISNFSWSPILHLRQVFAQFQKSRYDSAKETRDTLQLRLQYLREKQEREGDNPALAEQISYTQARVNRLENQIREVDEDLAEVN